MLQINASIARHHDKIWCTYQTKHLRHYNSESFLTELNADFEPISEMRLIPQNSNTAFEGIRLLSYNNKLLAFYNYLPFVENKGWQIQYGVGYGEVDTATGLIKNQQSLRQLSKREHEKNWSPYVFNNELYMITDYMPFLRIIKIGEPGNMPKEYFVSGRQTNIWQFGELRGGTPLLSEPGCKDGWLYGFAHSYKANEYGFKKYYYYTVARYNHQSKQLEYHSSPLPYNDDEIDEDYEKLWNHSNGRYRKVIYPIGITHHDNGLMVSFGKDEVLSFTEYFSWQRIKALF